MENSEKLIVGAVATVFGINAISGSISNSKNKELSNWENTHGTQGLINLNDVRDAFRDNAALKDFEQRVNEVYEGDNLVVFDAKEISGGFEMKGYEDLNANKQKDSSDDLLFTLSVKGRTATLKGSGVNKYYKETWIYEPPAGVAQQTTQQRSSMTSSPFFWWWVLSPGWGHYYTPYSRYDSIYSHRNSYRNTSNYRSQTGRNASFEKNMNTKYGSSFRSSMNSASSQRKSYIRNAPKSAGFKQKLAASKGKTGSARKSQIRSTTRTSRSFSGTSSRSSSSRSYGGFRGSSGFGI